MKYYAKYFFTQSPETPAVYILDSQFGSLPNFDLAKYTDCSRNRQSGLAGKLYVRVAEPRRPAMSKYFAYIFEAKGGSPVTSTEEIDSEGRTFGDAKSLGFADLILVKFSQDRHNMDLWVVRNGAKTKMAKFDGFARWTNGEELVPEYLEA